MDSQSSNPNEIQDRLPEAVLARLRAADRPAAANPRVDAAILAEARAYFIARDADSAASPAAHSDGGAPSVDAAAAGARDGARRRSRLNGLFGSTAGRSGARRAGARPKRTRWAAGIAAAAVAFAAFLVVRPLDRFAPYDPDDIDRSGRVDILDAFALARLRAGGAPISEADIDALAARVVALEPRRARP